MNPEIKSVFASKTVWGILIAALPTVLGLFKIEISDASAFTAGATEAVDSLITLLGSVLAIYGRIKATASLVVKK